MNQQQPGTGLSPIDSRPDSLHPCSHECNRNHQRSPGLLNIVWLSLVAAVILLLGLKFSRSLPWAIIREGLASIVEKRSPFGLTRKHLNQNNGNSLWGNLGLWTSSSEPYHIAAKRLAKTVGETAQLGEKDNILDIGIGSGDQILLWLEDFYVAKVTGIEPDSAGFLSASQRLKVFSNAIIIHGGFEKDEINSPTIHQQISLHQDLFGSSQSKCNKVLALDCAYFLPNPPFFWNTIADNIKALGTVTLTDLMLARHLNIRERILLRFISWLTRIPYSNWQTEQQYFQRQGIDRFNARVTRDLSVEVLDGFAAFFENQRKLNIENCPRHELVQPELTSLILKYMRRKNMIRYVMIHALKN